jgi:hypothetical protein
MTEVKQLAHLDIGAKSVQEATRAPVEANDLSTSRRELEWRPFLLPKWPEIATVAHESK